MKTSAIMKMVEDALYNLFSIIDIIIREDDSTILAVIKHPYKGAQGQFLKSSKGKNDEEITEPSLLADPYHHIKIVSKHIFPIVNKTKAQQCG